jgi:hypothetical protein
MAQPGTTEQGSKKASDKPGKDTIRPFQLSVPEADLTELRRRINNTKWPERETVTDATQGVQLATIQALARFPSGTCRCPGSRKRTGWKYTRVDAQQERRLERAHRLSAGS